MKIEKAIEILKEQKLFTPLGQACHVAIGALEKQVPQKAVMFFNKEILYCPSCTENVNKDDWYCSQCGQKIDWSEVKE